MRRVGVTVVLSLSLILSTALTASSSYATELVPAPIQTSFELDAPVPLDQVASALQTSGAQLIEIRNTGVNEGGYRPAPGTPIVVAAEQYRQKLFRLSAVLASAAASDDFSNPSLNASPDDPNAPQPLISGFTLSGAIAPSALGSLATRVASAQVVNLPTPALFPSDTPPAGQLDETLLNQILPVPADAADATPALAAASVSASWAPLNGRSITSQPGPGEASLIQTQTWSSTASIQSFGDNNAYEHDFKLINRNNSASLLHPLCGGQGDNYWADRNNSLVFVTNYPAAAKPYFDTDATDSCQTEDFTIGLYHPVRLSAGVRYVTIIAADRGQEPSSPYALVAQRLGRGCDFNPFCVGGPFGDHGSQLLIGATKGRAPECRRWHKGTTSVLCG